MLWLNFDPVAGVRARGAALPDFEDRGGHWALSVDLPGARREALSLAVEDGTLTVAASRETGTRDRVVRRERRDVQFRRTWSLPDGVTADLVEAAYVDGVLTVRVRKPEPVAPRRIEIQTH